MKIYKNITKSDRLREIRLLKKELRKSEPLVNELQKHLWYLEYLGEVDNSKKKKKKAVKRQ